MHPAIARVGPGAAAPSHDRGRACSYSLVDCPDLQNTPLPHFWVSSTRRVHCPCATEKPFSRSKRPMHEQFSDRARHAMALATREANRLQHDYIGPEHILMGLIAQGECVASTVLGHCGVNLSKVRAELDRQIQAGHAPTEIGRRPYNPETK